MISNLKKSLFVIATLIVSLHVTGAQAATAVVSGDDITVSWDYYNWVKPPNPWCSITIFESKNGGAYVYKSVHGGSYSACYTWATNSEIFANRSPGTYKYRLHVAFEFGIFDDYTNTVTVN